MFMRKILILALSIGTAHMAVAQESRFGEKATQADIDKRFFSIFPDGENLPTGSGTAAIGAALYEDQCELCHGTPEEKGLNDVLFGGHGTIGTDHALATVGSYWPYATTVFNYVRRAMPFTAPMSMTNSEYYSITAYLLHKNGIIGENDVMNKDTLYKVEMPNKDGFVSAHPEIPEKYRTKP
jgi:S-disulfanyl-L-cysteine oxidoreductase SoxD